MSVILTGTVTDDRSQAGGCLCEDGPTNNLFGGDVPPECLATSAGVANTMYAFRIRLDPSSLRELRATSIDSFSREALVDCCFGSRQ